MAGFCLAQMSWRHAKKAGFSVAGEGKEEEYKH